MRLRKIFLFMLCCLTGLCFLCSCSTAKIPASDTKALSRYEKEIEVLRSNDAPVTAKYEAAETVFANLDFSYVRDVSMLARVLGKGEPKRTFDGGTLIEYNYQLGNKSIVARFWIDRGLVLRHEVVYKDPELDKDSSDSKQQGKLLPRGDGSWKVSK